MLIPLLGQHDDSLLHHPRSIILLSNSASTQTGVRELCEHDFHCGRRDSEHRRQCQRLRRFGDHRRRVLHHSLAIDPGGPFVQPVAMAYAA